MLIRGGAPEPGARVRDASSPASAGNPDGLREARHPAPARAELGAPAPDLDGPIPWVERDCTPVGTTVERGRCEILIKIYGDGLFTQWPHGNGRSGPGRPVGIDFAIGERWSQDGTPCAPPPAGDDTALPTLGAANDADGDRNMIAGAVFFLTPSDSMALIINSVHEHADIFTSNIISFSFIHNSTVGLNEVTDPVFPNCVGQDIR